MKNLRKIIVQILVVIVFSSASALLVNWVRMDGLALVMPFPPEYRCSSQMKEGRAMQAKEALEQYGLPGVMFVDARSEEAFGKGHIKGAMNVPYSFLEAVPREAVERLRRYKVVIVYCNTENIERSKLMAGELSEAGLRDTSYLDGGLLAWIKAGGPHTGQKPVGYEHGT